MKSLSFQLISCLQTLPISIQPFSNPNTGYLQHAKASRLEKEPTRHRYRDSNRGCCVRWLHKCRTWRMWHAFDHCCLSLPATTPPPHLLVQLHLHLGTPRQVCDDILPLDLMSLPMSRLRLQQNAWFVINSSVCRLAWLCLSLRLSLSFCLLPP